MLRRLLIGILKGLLVGGAVGAGLHFGLGKTTLESALLTYPLYGAVGALAGVTAGKPFWRQGAGIEAILRSIFGIAVGCGLYALAAAFIGKVPFDVGTIQAGSTQFAHIPLLMAPTLAILYASLVELDNDGKAEEVAPSRVRVVDVDDIKVDEDEELPAKQSGKATKRR
ncbi:MAG: hypothetical protein R3A52_09570 [Polyangiales bacterium]